MGNFYHMVFYPGGGGDGERNPWGGVPCDTGFNSPTEKGCREHSNMGNTRLGPHYFKSLDVFYIKISKH